MTFHAEPVGYVMCDRCLACELAASPCAPPPGWGMAVYPTDVRLDFCEKCRDLSAVPITFSVLEEEAIVVLQRVLGLTREGVLSSALRSYVSVVDIAYETDVIVLDCKVIHDKVNEHKRKQEMH